MSATSVGIIGAGGIVSKMHLPTLMALDWTSVSWVLDRDASRLQDLALGFGVPTHVSTGDITGMPDVDAVLLAVPYGARAVFYDQLEGRKVYVEKPLARTVRAHDDLVGRLPGLGVGFQLRGSAAAQTARQLVRDGAIGDLYSVEVHHGFPGQLTGSAYSANFDLAGGGMLFEVGIHWLDLALYLAAAHEVTMVSGRMVNEGGFDLDTQAQLRLSTDLGEVDLAVLISGLRRTDNCVRLHGSSATLTLRSPASLTLKGRRSESGGEFHVTLAPAPVEPFQLCASAWSDFLSNDPVQDDSWTSAATSRVTTRAIELLYGLAP